MLKKLTELLSDAATYGTSGIIAQLIGFALLPLYTRYLTPADYGVAAMLGVLGAIFLPLSGLGVTNAIFRRFNLSEDPDERKRLLSTGLWSVSIGSIALAGLGVLFAAPLSSLLIGSDKYSKLVELTLICGVGSAISEVPRVALRANRRVRMTVFVGLASLVAGVATTILLVARLRWGVLGLVVGNVSGSVVGCLVIYAVTWRSFALSFRYDTWKEMLGYGLPFVPHRFFAFGMAQFGQYMVAHMLGLEQAGLYSIAMRLSMPISFVITAIQRAWEPYKFQIYARDAEPAAFFQSVTIYYVSAVFYLWLGVSALGPELIRLITTSEFSRAGVLVPAVGLISVAQGLYFMLGTGIELGRDMRVLPLVSLSGLVTLILSSVLLIPGLGAIGAALATILGWSSMTVVILYFSQRIFRIRYDWQSIALLSGAAVTMVVISALTQGTGSSVRLAIALLLCAAYPFLTIGVLSRSSVEGARVAALRLRVKQGLPGLVSGFVKVL